MQSGHKFIFYTSLWLCNRRECEKIRGRLMKEIIAIQLCKTDDKSPQLPNSVAQYTRLYQGVLYSQNFVGLNGTHNNVI